MLTPRACVRLRHFPKYHAGEPRRWVHGQYKRWVCFFFGVGSFLVLKGNQEKNHHFVGDPYFETQPDPFQINRPNFARDLSKPPASRDGSPHVACALLSMCVLFTFSIFLETLCFISATELSDQLGSCEALYRRMRGELGYLLPAQSWTHNQSVNPSPEPCVPTSKRQIAWEWSTSIPPPPTANK